ncbi:MAG: AAA family ATPase [Candidatus Woesearchaeota archaeon]
MLRKHFEQLSTQDNHFSFIVGQKQVKQQVLSALISGRHIILVGPPGIGKTSLAKEIAHLLPQKDKFVRVQGSPDLSAEDLLGDIDPIKALEFGPTSPQAFVKGKLFEANQGVLFFDEVNRCSAKLQNALLQVLEEGYATIGSYRVDFPTDFIFIGTMNPHDASTEELSHVFLDRFDLIQVGYPKTPQEEREILQKSALHLPVTFGEQQQQFIVEFIQRIRASDKVEQAPSVRATLGLYERAQANALLEQQQKVSYKHIFQSIVSVLPHRLTLKPSIKYMVSTQQFIAEQLKQFSTEKGVDTQEGEVP